MRLQRCMLPEDFVGREFCPYAGLQRNKATSTRLPTTMMEFGGDCNDDSGASSGDLRPEMMSMLWIVDNPDGLNDNGMVQLQ